MFLFSYKTIWGQIALVETRRESGLCQVLLPGEECPAPFLIRETALMQEAVWQLNKYFRGELDEFSVPLLPQGTPFRQKVWQVLREIPYGATATYKEVAEKIKNPRAFRAVGQACHCNPLPFFIPCHRVVGSQGHLTGYRGGLALKRKLLLLEKGEEMEKMV